MRSTGETTIAMVVFDIGGVMIRLAGGWEGACQRAGLPLHQSALGEVVSSQVALLEEQTNIGAISPRVFFQKLCTITDHVYSIAEMTAIYQAVICEEMSGIYEIVQALKSQGILTACLSNTCEMHWCDLSNPAHYPAINSLDYLHASHLFGVAKPDPQIYHCFERATGVIPAQILFFDDREENVSAAIQCGWHARRITGLLPPVEQIVSTLIEFDIELIEYSSSH